LITDLPRTWDVRQAPAWGSYHADQNVWRPIVRDIEAIATSPSTIIPWDQVIAYELRSLRSEFDLHLRILQPLQTLSEEARKGTLGQYLRRRGISVSTGDALFLLLPSIVGQERAVDMATQTLCGSGFVDCGRASVAVAREWPGMRTLTHIYGQRMVLYRVNIER
jgi:hypothetical protein